MYRKVLLPLDGSELAECSLDHAKSVAAKDGITEVILLRVVEPMGANDAAAWAQAGYMVPEVEKGNWRMPKSIFLWRPKN